MIKTAKKKPIVVECHQFTKETKEWCINFIETYKLESETVRVEGDDVYLQKARGEIKLSMNNWILYEINTDKEIWFIDDSIFKKTYNWKEGNLFSKHIFEVKFLKFTEDEKFIRELIDFVTWDKLTIKNEDELNLFINKNGYVEIITLEGVEKFHLGEILIQGIEGEFYPTKEANFNNVYDY